MQSWKDNIYFVLVEPMEAGNIGASASAIKNMGFKNLSLVKPKLPISDDAKFKAFYWQSGHFRIGTENVARLMLSSE